MGRPFRCPPHRGGTRLPALLVALLVLALPAAAAGAPPPFAPDPPAPATDADREGPPPRLVVHLADGAGDATTLGRVGTLAATAAELDLTRRHAIDALDAVVYELPADADAALAAAADRLAALPAVERVERDGVAVVAQRIPDDPGWPDQWGLRTIDAPTAWETTTGEADVVIAVLDTGVDADHEDLAGAVLDGRNLTAGGDPDDTSDPHGHGTQVAGVAAARTDNGLGVAGTCWDCRILPVTVMDADGVGANADIAAGIVWAVDAGADVLNLSLGSLTDTRVLGDAVRYATTRGVPVVASAGNVDPSGDTDASQPMYPAAYDEALGVAATDPADDRYAFSRFGDWVALAAPGCNPTTDLLDTYRWFCGTSSSAPLVAGTLGLATAAEPDASRERLEQALTETAVDVGDFVVHGRIDAAATLAVLPDLPDPEPEQPAPRPPAVSPDDDEAETEPGLALRRVAGANRFETAARLSLGAFAPGVRRAYLATGLGFADALAAGAVAGRDAGPVLLATRDTLPGATAEELRRLEPGEVVVVGGTGVISSRVADDAARAAGTSSARRIAGADRFDTAARLARAAFPAPVPAAYVATGTDFADALAGVPAAVVEEAPVLLATRDRLPGVTRDALAALSPERIVVLGGTAAISQSVERELAGLAGGGGVQRLAGPGRFDTAARIAAAAFGEPRVASVHLATGFDFPDALAGGPVAGLDGGPLLLVARDQLPAVTAEQLRRLEPRANVVLGGRAVISDAVEAAAGEASAGQ